MLKGEQSGTMALGIAADANWERAECAILNRQRQCASAKLEA